MKEIAHLWRHHRLALIGFVLAIAATLFFAVRMILFTVYWANPTHHQQPLAGWMTPRYVARSWHVPPDLVLSAAGASQEPGHPQSLAEIARGRGVPLSQVIGEVEAAIAGAGPGATTGTGAGAEGQ